MIIKRSDREDALSKIWHSKNIDDEYEILFDYISKHGRDAEMERDVKLHHRYKVYKQFEEVFDKCGCDKDDLIKYLDGYEHYIGEYGL